MHTLMEGLKTRIISFHFSMSFAPWRCQGHLTYQSTSDIPVALTVGSMLGRWCIKSACFFETSPKGGVRRYIRGWRRLTVCTPTCRCGNLLFTPISAKHYKYSPTVTYPVSMCCLSPLVTPHLWTLLAQRWAIKLSRALSSEDVCYHTCTRKKCTLV